MTEYNLKGTYEPRSLDDVVGEMGNRYPANPLHPLIKDNLRRAAASFLVGASVTMVDIYFGSNYTWQSILGEAAAWTAVTVPADYFGIAKKKITKALAVAPGAFAGLYAGIHFMLYSSK